MFNDKDPKQDHIQLIDLAKDLGFVETDKLINFRHAIREAYQTEDQQLLSSWRQDYEVMVEQENSLPAGNTIEINLQLVSTLAMIAAICAENGDHLSLRQVASEIEKYTEEIINDSDYDPDSHQAKIIQTIQKFLGIGHLPIPTKKPEETANEQEFTPKELYDLADKLGFRSIVALDRIYKRMIEASKTGDMERFHLSLRDYNALGARLISEVPSHRQGSLHLGLIIRNIAIALETDHPDLLKETVTVLGKSLRQITDVSQPNLETAYMVYKNYQNE